MTSTTSTTTQSPYLVHSLSTVQYTIATNIATFIVGLLLFSLCLQSKCLFRLLAPRLAATQELPPCFCIGWLTTSWSHRKDLSVDGAVMVRFCILGFKFSIAGCVPCPLLMWLYSRDDLSGDPDNFSKFILSRREGETKLWTVIAVAYYMVFVFFIFAEQEWRYFLKIRRRHFFAVIQGEVGKESGVAQAQRSILVEMVPESLRDESGSGVREFFDGLFPDRGIHSVVLQSDTRAYYRRSGAVVRKTGQEMMTRMRSIFVDVDTPQDRGMLRSQHARPSKAVKAVSALSLKESEKLVDLNWRKTVMGESDSEEEEGDQHSTTAALISLGRHVRHGAFNLGLDAVGKAGVAARLVQAATIGHNGSETAFVTFHTVADRLIAERLMLSESGAWRARAAPEASDMVWANAAIPLSQLAVRSWMANILLLLGIILWSFPIAGLQMIVALDWWHPEHTILQALKVQCPVYAQMGLLSLLPCMFEWLARVYEGHKVHSEIEYLTLRRFFNFQLATIWVTVGFGAFFASMGQIIHKPVNALLLMREEVTQVATYFLTFVVARVGISIPLLLLCPVLSAICPESTDEGTGLPPVRPNFAMEASNLGLVLVLGMTYCVICPAIMPACAMYFGMACLVYQWLFLYVYTPCFDCGGNLWYYLFRGSMTGLFLGNFALAGLAYTLGEREHFIACVFLCVIIGAFSWNINVHYKMPSFHISLEQARLADLLAGDGFANSFQDDYYLDPIIKDALKVERDELDHDEESLGGDVAWGSSCACLRRWRTAAEFEELGDDTESVSG